MAEKFQEMSEDYITVILELIDFAKQHKIIPRGYALFTDSIKATVKLREMLMIENGVKYLLPNKEVIINSLKNNCAYDDMKNKLKSCNELRQIELAMRESDMSISVLFEILDKAKNSSDIIKSEIEEYITTMILILEDMVKL